MTHTPPQRAISVESAWRGGYATQLSIALLRRTAQRALAHRATRGGRGPLVCCTGAARAGAARKEAPTPRVGTLRAGAERTEPNRGRWMARLRPAMMSPALVE